MPKHTSYRPSIPHKSPVLSRLDPAQCVHLVVDMQKYFMPAMAEFANPLSRRVVGFAHQVKQLGVPTIWLAWPQMGVGKARGHKIMFASAAREILNAKNQLINGAPDDDFATMKFNCDGFTNPNLGRFITGELKRPQVLVTGVFMADCVADTIWGGLRHGMAKKNGARMEFVAVADHIGPCVQPQDPDTGERYRHSRLSKSDYAGMVDENMGYWQQFRAEHHVSSARLGVAQACHVLQQLGAAPQEKRPTLVGSASSSFTLQVA